VAEQVGALTEKTVVVVPTRSMPEALAALVAYDADADASDTAAAMRDAAESVVAGEVTQAVRDSSSSVGPVAQGDWIGLVKGDGIAAVAPTIEAAVVALLDVIVGDGAELVTVITGRDADAATTDTLRGWLADHHGDVAVEVHHGGQPLYPYLFGVE
jgi:dihydroxyacetone kinase-like predicted kinase